MRKCLFVLFLILFTINSNSIASVQTLDDGLSDLASQITVGMSEGKKRKIAVVEFSNLDGKITEFGKFLSEELITKLFMSKRFRVVERQLLNKIINEHKLNMVGLIDKSTAKELGNILGVDAICSGTITDLVSSVKINARLISTETGSIFSVASSNIKKDSVVEKLMGKSTYVTSMKPSGAIVRTELKGNVFFYQDFSSVTEGSIPDGWTADDTIVVGQVGRSKALYLAPSGRASGVAMTQSINFPKDFKLEVVVSVPNSCWGQFNVQVGAVSFGNKCCGVVFNKDSEHQCEIGRQAVFELKKEGNIFSLSMNGKQYHLKRLSGYKPPEHIRIKLYGDKRLYVVIHQIKITDLS